MKITKIGHCCVIIETKNVRFLTDPGNYTTGQNEATNIDCIVISHEHTDHTQVESIKIILKNNPNAMVVTNSAVGMILEKEGIQYIKVSGGEHAEIKGVKIEGYGVHHAPIYKEYELVENTGYRIDEKFFYPGDGFYNPQVPVEILALPITGPWCTIAQSMRYALEVSPKKVFPIHDGNLIRHGITNRLPALFLPEAGIEFFTPEIGKEIEV